MLERSAISIKNMRGTLGLRDELFRAYQERLERDTEDRLYSLEARASNKATRAVWEQMRAYPELADLAIEIKQEVSSGLNPFEYFSPRDLAAMEVSSRVFNRWAKRWDELRAQYLEPAKRDILKRIQYRAQEQTNRDLAKIENWLNKVDDATCYRVLQLPANVDPTTLKNIGICWSTNRDLAGAYCGIEIYANARSAALERYWMFRARVNPDAINLRVTFKVNVIHGLIQEFRQDEVRMKRGAAIWVRDVCPVYGYFGGRLVDNAHKFGKPISIRAWRRT